MMQFLNLFIEIFFTLLIFGCSSILILATVADLMGWYDSRGRYCGPFSKVRRK